MIFFRRLKKSIFPSEQKKIIRRWRKDGGDEKFRYTYDLTPDSVVMDVGGFEGEWAEKIFQRYGCLIHIFEPVASFYTMIEKKIEGNGKVTVYDFGLGGTDRKETISVDENASSIYKSDGAHEEITIVGIIGWLKKHKITEVDLIKINIEGGEFELLEKLIENNTLDLFRNIQVQFHRFAPNADARMGEIQKQLSKTHRATYSYPYIWENWERTESSQRKS
jgi:FkbM family methyltransferase